MKDKQLLLKDLSARLPYGVICKWENDDGYKGGGKLINVCREKTSGNYIYWDCYFEDENIDIPIEIVKPYLRPMNQMTEKEKEEYGQIEEEWMRVDYLDSHALDHRGLLEKGLANEAKGGDI